jgi:ribosomal protein L3 glutamine methyltransferase
MSEQPDGLISILDFVRWGASRFNAAGLCFGHGTDNGLDEAMHLVLHVLHLPPDLPPAYRACRLTPAERVAVTDLVDRRIQERKPAAYLTQRAWFAGIEFYVNEDVLVPRSPLAELVEAGFDPWIDADHVTRVLDLCAGSGCIGIAAAVYLPHVAVDLAELSQAALAVAETNIENHGLGDRVEAVESNLFSALEGRRYEVIVSNPPYVGAEELAGLPEEYHKEPTLGLAGGETGLDLVLQILRDAPNYLSHEGILVVEVGNTAEALTRRFPDLPFLWLEFERGGEGVFLLNRDQLIDYHEAFAEAAETL